MSDTKSTPWLAEAAVQCRDFEKERDAALAEVERLKRRPNECANCYVLPPHERNDLTAKLDIATALISEALNMWLKHGDFYKVSDHEAWLKKAQDTLTKLRGKP